MYSAILILAYKRPLELKKVLDSIVQMDDVKIYFHIHDCPTSEGQGLVEQTKKVISEYKGKKSVKYSKEAIGCRNSMISGLRWIASMEKKFYVFEDDIILHDGAYPELKEEFDVLESGLLKFGPTPDYAVFWGWAATSDAALRIIDANLDDITLEQAKEVVTSETHLAGIKEIYKRGQNMAWDDEFLFICKSYKIPVFNTKKPMTDHIGVSSTRIDNEIDKPWEKWHVTFENKKIIA